MTSMVMGRTQNSQLPTERFLVCLGSGTEGQIILLFIFVRFRYFLFYSLNLLLGFDLLSETTS